MPATTEWQSPAAMRSDYNENSQGQLQLVNMALPYIKTGIDAHSAKLTSPLIFADFGSSTGANSSVAMSAIIDCFRQKYGNNDQILVVHEDIPQNNWTELFNYMQSDNQSYLQQHAGVFATASGRSFCEQVLPDGCLQIGFSSSALHWLSRLPVKIENHCLPSRASAEERKLFEQQAADDWKALLTARSRELANGGVFVAHIVSGSECQYIDVIIGDSLYAAASRLKDEGVITRQEQLDFNIGVVYRSLDDVTEPTLLQSLSLEVVSASFAQPSGEISGLEFNNGLDAICKMIMAAMQPSFAQALSASRPDSEKTAICSKLAEAYTEELQKLPREAFTESVAESLFLVLKKM